MSISHATGKFMLAVAALPAVQALPAESTIERLATGSAQLVLAAVVVVEACAIYKLFSQWRKDVSDAYEKLRQDSAAGQDKLQELMDKNTAAMTANKASNDQLCHTIERFGNVVDRCVHNRE